MRATLPSIAMIFPPAKCGSISDYPFQVPCPIFPWTPKQIHFPSYFAVSHISNPIFNSQTRSSSSNIKPTKPTYTSPQSPIPMTSPIPTPIAIPNTRSPAPNPILTLLPIHPPPTNYRLNPSSTRPPISSTLLTNLLLSANCSLIKSTVFFNTTLSLLPWPSNPGTSSVNRSKPSRIARRRFCSEAI